MELARKLVFGEKRGYININREILGTGLNVPGCNICVAYSLTLQRFLISFENWIINSEIESCQQR